MTWAQFEHSLGTPNILEGDQIAQVIENKMVGDTGFEPVTSTVWR